MDRPIERVRGAGPKGSRFGRGLVRLTHDRRVVLLALLAGLPGVAVSLLLLWLGDYPARLRWTLAPALVGLWLLAAFALRDRVVRPLQTLANMLAALREGDFSIRARVPVENADDPLSLTYHEVNALEELLREQRLGAVEATELLRKVQEEVDVAIFAFDEETCLRLVNRAGEKLLGQPADRLLGRRAGDLRLDDALSGVAPRTIELSHPGGTGRWELRRSAVRQGGVRLRLLVLSDLSRALREEERQAWKRIIRVLSHEINNSLAPIKSITGSLQTLLRRDVRPPDLDDDLGRGLQVIQGRAEALGRFMAAYARLARLPEPDLTRVEVEPMVRRVAALEPRLPVGVTPGPGVVLQADPDQLEQVLINVIRNATDATLAGDEGTAPRAPAQGEEPVRVRWLVDDGKLHLLVEDRGPGVPDSANLFVPFYTTKPGGSGIGLVLSRQIVEGHGGTLELENRDDGPGARARITLPIEADA
jgi:two-component system, NtrC family, nitrogen regulation sensor histidine kinase NtrY